MILKTKQEEYEIMLNSSKRTIKVEIPNGPKLDFHNSWDYKTNLTETTFKTNTYVEVGHPLLTVSVLDLSPVTTEKIWSIKILRQLPPLTKTKK